MRVISSLFNRVVAARARTARAVRSRRWLVLALVISAMLGSGVVTAAASIRSGAGRANGSGTALLRLSNEVAPALSAALRRGSLHAVPASSTAARAQRTFTVTLRRTHQAAFERFLAAVENPRSGQFRHFLTQGQLAARFGPTRGVYDRVLSWLRSKGFRLVQGSANRLTLTVRGTEAQARRAFNVRIEELAARDGKQLYANTDDPALPASFAGDVEDVAGLSNIGEPSLTQPVARPLPRAGIALDYIGCLWDLQLANLSYSTGGYLGGNISQLRDHCAANAAHNHSFPFARRASVAGHAALARAADAVDGTGQKVGLLEFDTFHPSDVADYVSLMGLPASAAADVSETAVNGGVSSPGSGESEVLLDIDTVLTIAPGAHVVVYDAPSSTSWETLLNAMIGDGDTVISNSWSSCEDQVSKAEAQSIDQVLQSAAAAGVSVLNGSGDDGSTCLDGSANTVGVPADSPNATAVGGTTLTGGTDGVYGSETWWNGSDATPQTGQGGYGVSRYFSRPSYQDADTSASGRSVPDVALNADPAGGYAICEADAGGCPTGLFYGGTSAATPMMAAFTALLNESQGTDLGALNPRFYPLGGTDAFHDAASMGSDFAHVGLGSPNVSTLGLKLRDAEAGPVSQSQSFVLDDAPSGATPADGSTVDNVTVFLRDANGNAISGKTVSLSANAGSSATVTPVDGVTSVNNGAALFHVTDTTAEQVTLTATDTTDNVTLAPYTIDFVTPTATGAQITASQTDAADATVDVYLQNAQGRPAVGKSVSLTASGGSATISPAGGTQTTDSNGDAVFQVNDSNQETVTFTATDETDGNLPVPGSATVNFNSPSTTCDPGPPTTNSPYAISNWATDAPFNANAFYVSSVYFGPCDGVGQPAFDASGNAYLPDNVNGEIYELGAGGGALGAANALPDADFAADDLDSVAVDKAGNLYAALGALNGNFGDPEIVQLDPATGAIERVIADTSTGLGECPGEMAADPVSGNLFITDYCTFGNTSDLEEITDPASASPTVVNDYATLPSTGGIGSDGIAIDPAGTIYLAVPGSSNPVVSVTGPSAAKPGTVTVLDDSTSDPDENIVGVAVAATDASGHATALYATTGDYGFSQGNDGELLRLDAIDAPPVTGTVIAGPRSDAGLYDPTTSPDGCTYIAATDVVYELATGSGCSGVSNPAPTVTLSSSGPSPAPLGSSVTYTAQLSNFSSDAGVPVTLGITGANSQVQLVRTDSSGKATFTEQGVLSGGDQVTASAPDADSGTTITSAPVEQRWITGSGSRDVTYLDLNSDPQGGLAARAVSLSAYLYDISQVPAATVSGAPVTLSLAGRSCTAQTSASGEASCSVTPSGAQGLGTITASYAGDAAYTPSTASNPFALDGVGLAAQIASATARPKISGSPKPGHTLTCSEGSWTNSPVSFTYQWRLDGTPLSGATKSTFTVSTVDEGTTLSCAVVALNAAGASAPAISQGVKVAVPRVRGCPAATGSVSTSAIGPVKLRMTRKQAKHVYRRSSSRGKQYQTFFCLTPRGVRVGYASPKLLKLAKRSQRARLKGRVIWISTSNERYSIRGIRPGASLTAARKALPKGSLFHVGKNYWYLARWGKGTAIFKERGGVVQEIGIAQRSVTASKRADGRFLTSFS